jgi:hypothetical protein
MAHEQVRMDDVCSNTPQFYDRAISPSTELTVRSQRGARNSKAPAAAAPMRPTLRRSMARAPFGFNLSESAKRELIEYLKSL